LQTGLNCCHTDPFGDCLGRLANREYAFHLPHGPLHLRSHGRGSCGSAKRVVADSRKVADVFKKRHADVLRDIEVLFSTNPNLGALNWLRAIDYVDARGRTQP
jgi:hypothetical protein